MTNWFEKIPELAKRIPEDFVFGAATSSWQIEGSSTTRGSSIWDDFAKKPGNIVDGASGDPACDHLNRMEADLDLLSDLGVDSYRFSVSWPRVIPSGRGNPNQNGLDLYDRLIDGLLERGIKPALTIYHWDLPSELQATGGWANSEIYERFQNYTLVLAQKFSDRVFSWSTLNEPWVSAYLGHASGVHAPGIKDPKIAFEVAYRLMVASGKAIEVLRDYSAKNVGIVLNLTTVIADDSASQPAARHIDNLHNRFWLDLLAGRGLSDEIINSTKEFTNWDFVDESGLGFAAKPIDWLGVNYYFPMRVASKPAVGTGHVVGQSPVLFPGCPPVHFTPREPQTEMGWEIDPSSLTTTLKRIQTDLPDIPLYVTENGGAFPDQFVNGEVDDTDRVEYYARHLDAALKAIEDGVNLKGYYAWSLLDNLEWAEGWTKRFGIVRVSEDNLSRIPKLSFKYLKELFQSRG